MGTHRPGLATCTYARMYVCALLYGNGSWQHSFTRTTTDCSDYSQLAAVNSGCILAARARRGGGSGQVPSSLTDHLRACHGGGSTKSAGRAGDRRVPREVRRSSAAGRYLHTSQTGLCCRCQPPTTMAWSRLPLALLLIAALACCEEDGE